MHIGAFAVAATLGVVGPPPAVMTCDVGDTPRYFVPAHGPSTLLGCARLPVSGRAVEFLANVGRIDGASELCIDPSYGHGTFIPGICKLEPSASAFAIRAAGEVQGYGYVVWGTAGGAESVTVGCDGAVAETARLDVPATIARRYGAAAFSLFVAELPACGLATGSSPRAWRR